MGWAREGTSERGLSDDLRAAIATLEPEIQELLAAPLPPDRRTFAVHQEAEGVFGLYLAPVTPGFLLDLIDRLPALDGVLVDVTPLFAEAIGPITTACPIDVSELSELEAPLELIHTPDDTVQPSPTTVLAAPELALPDGSGRRFAFSLEDGFHGVLFTRERAVLAAAIDAFLAPALSDESSPSLPARGFSRLAQSIPDSSWHELEVERRDAVWTATFTTRSAEGGELTIQASERWIGRAGQAWRAGWDW